MASAAAGIEFLAWSGRHRSPGGAVGAATEDHHGADHEPDRGRRRKQPGEKCASADSLRGGDRDGTSVVSQSRDLPAPRTPLDDRGDWVSGEIAVIDDRGDHHRGWRLFRAP